MAGLTSVLRTELLQLRQERDESFRMFATRVQGKAETCAFSTKCSCGLAIDYTNHVIRDVLLNGIVDVDIQCDILSKSKILETPVNEVIRLVENKEMALQASSSPTPSALSSFRQQREGPTGKDKPPTTLSAADRSKKAIFPECNELRNCLSWSVKTEHHDMDNNSATTSPAACVDHIKQEQSVVISSYDSIVGCAKMGQGSKTTTITVTDMKTEVMEEYSDRTSDREDTADMKTDEIVNSDTGILQDNSMRNEVDWLPELNCDVDKHETAAIKYSSAEGMCSHTQKIAIEKVHVCKVCGKCFSFKSQLKQHGLSHTGKRLHTCAICGKSFIRKSDLTTHELLHTGEKPHSCAVCGKSFTRKYHMTRHQLLHTGEKQYTCAICGKSFADKSALNRHEVLHTGVKPHSCTVCGKSFTLKNNLTQHQLVHTGEKPYSCSYCGKMFARKRDFRKHELLHVS